MGLLLQTPRRRSLRGTYQHHGFRVSINSPLEVKGCPFTSPTGGPGICSTQFHPNPNQAAMRCSVSCSRSTADTRVFEEFAWSTLNQMLAKMILRQGDLAKRQDVPGIPSFIRLVVLGAAGETCPKAFKGSKA